MSRLKLSSENQFDDNMDEDLDDKDSKRKSRNLSEKKRRDQFNLLVNELSKMVTNGGRKMDKSSVLKSAILFLKKHNEIEIHSRVNEIQEDWKPKFLTNEEFTHLILEATNGFIIVFSVYGQIFYVSENITSLLGHLPDELLNSSFYELTSAEEQANLYNILLNTLDDENQLLFPCLLHRRKIGRKFSKNFYEPIDFIGYFKSDDEIQAQKDCYTNEGDTRLVFVGTGRLQTPQLLSEIPLLSNANRNEFVSRHNLEWKFLFLDHRATQIIGYLPFELLGTSGYDYYHYDDLEQIVACHELLIQKGELTSDLYRFLTKGQQWIWLQTRYYITYHQMNSKPEFIVCTHCVVSYNDVRKLTKKSEINTQMDEINFSNAWQPKNIDENLTNPTVSSNSMSFSSDSSHSQQSMKSKSTNNSNEMQLHSNEDQLHHYLETQQFNETTIPALIDTSSPLEQTINEPDYNLNQSNPQCQIQMDLLRKHAELETIICQQQEELRKVSEQLLMAKLGLLPNSSIQNENTCVNSTMNSIQLIPNDSTNHLLAPIMDEQFTQNESDCDL